MANEPGLRERKKRQTRELIASTAFALFAARGFDRVPVAEVARQADVSVATVFNYFPTKEDLMYLGFEAFQATLIEAMRQREPGQTLLDAFGGFMLRPYGLLGPRSAEADAHLVAAARIISGSAALIARERQVYDDFVAAMAELIASETRAKPDDITPWVRANAMLGVHRALVEFVRKQVLATGTVSPQLPRRLRAQAERALAAL